MGPLQAAIAALLVCGGQAVAQPDQGAPRSNRPDNHGHVHALHEHSTHEHESDHNDENEERAHGQKLVGAHSHEAGNSHPSAGRPFAWLGAYCIAIVAASLFGGWLPQWFVLSHNRMQVAISLIGGLMLGIGVFHMLPHALVELGPTGPDVAAHGLMAGLVVMFFLLRAFHFHHHGTLDSLHHEHESDCGQDHDHGHALQSGRTDPGATRSLSWVGVFLGMSFHSIGDGLALGASIEADSLHGVAAWPGLGTFLAVALHKPVDSISITTMMAARGWSSRWRALVNAGFSLICPLGALLFVMGVRALSGPQGTIVGVALAISAGVFICIALGDLLPEMEFHSHNRMRLTLALLAGVALAWAIRFVESPHSHAHDAGQHAHEH